MNYVRNELFIVGRLVYSRHSIGADMQFEKESVGRRAARETLYILFKWHTVAARVEYRMVAGCFESRRCDACTGRQEKKKRERVNCSKVAPISVRRLPPKTAQARPAFLLLFRRHSDSTGARLTFQRRSLARVTIMIVRSVSKVRPSGY